jgi:uncharacterized protein
MGDLKIYEYKKKDVSNALVIVSFPTVGLISTIVANFLTSNMKLERIAAIVSDDFYPAAIIQDGVPTPPVRIFAGDHVCGKDGECEQIVVITSELPVKTTVFSQLADKVLEWCKKRDCKVIVTLEGINSQDPIDEDNIKVFHVFSNKKAGDYIKGFPTKALDNGMVSGLSGLLLYKANMQDYPVISLLAEAHAEFPDSRSAAKVLTLLDKMVPQIKMDPEPLLKQAKVIEEQVKKAMAQIKPMSPKELPETLPGMYS